ncbi:hypothetical protein QC764_0053380 [Podospora pseudoanserina]|uniref:Uncharacterized protein n=1 Tax=Podospora pseudoanserina TaxID=2609844 RepID=A0ABR0IDC0_9PEZI|nr:hypothetical protein QC764_0053380 [Podospora pseudoanserina]
MNALFGFYKNYSRIEESALPRTQFQRPLPEDYAMRGLTWADRVSPNTFFSNEKIDDDEEYVEFPFTAEERKARVLWLGHKIASSSKWLRYNSSIHEFSVDDDEGDEGDEGGQGGAVEKERWRGKGSWEEG